MRKAIVAMVLLGFFAAALADGCGGDDDEGEPTRAVITTESPVRNLTPRATATPLPNATATPTPTYHERAMGEYSYALDSNCQDGKRRDPITVVFDGGGTFTDVHAPRHGLDEPGGVPALVRIVYDTRQKFYAAGRCLEDDLDVASEMIISTSRWHMRGRVAEDDAYAGTWAVGTPHFDKATPCHAVPATYEGDDVTFPPLRGRSGFDAGRAWVVRRWTVDAQHMRLRHEYWGNIALMKQCNGDKSGSDGYVDFIEIAGRSE